MLRRQAISILLGAAAGRADAGAAVVLVDVRTKKLLAAEQRGIAESAAVPPGSTVKPFSLSALLSLGRLRADEEFLCPRQLEIGGRSYACSHPSTPMQVRLAIAYSCNCFVAHYAERFAPGELPAALERPGFRSRASDSRLQAIGEAGVLVTAAQLAFAYRRLALNAPGPVRCGLEDAVALGTAQHARLEGVQVAGKTGSTHSAGDGYVACFAGFAPSRAPEVAIAVMAAGKSGGAEAAPLAARLLRAHFGGRA